MDTAAGEGMFEADEERGAGFAFGGCAEETDLAFAFAYV